MGGNSSSEEKPKPPLVEARWTMVGFISMFGQMMPRLEGVVSSILSSFPRHQTIVNHRTYYSFGDEGLTATVGSSGSLLQMTWHLPGEKAGFSVTDGTMPEPYRVIDRVVQLLHRATMPEFQTGVRPNDISLTGVGPCLDISTSDGQLPEASFTDGRWPTFIGAHGDSTNCKIQYTAAGGILYQTFDFYCDNSEGNDRCGSNKSKLQGTTPKYIRPPNFVIKGNALIQYLDYNDPNNKFNNLSSQANASRSLCQDNYIILAHTNVVSISDGLNSENMKNSTEHEDSQDSDGPNGSESSEKTSDREDSETDMTAFLYIKAFSKQCTIKFRSCDINDGRLRLRVYETEFDSKDMELRLEKLTITFAYTLRRERNVKLLIMPSIPENLPNMCGKYYRSQTFTGNQQLDSLLQRNLEHILSVCSVPVTNGDGSWKRNEDDLEPPVALTCGDLDGHRVSSAASFYAFQILLLALNHFTKKHTELCECKPESNSQTQCYACQMKRRIERVCRGHLKWLFGCANRPKGLFCANYWIDGETVPDSDYLPKKSLADDVFHIIKAGDYSQIPGQQIPDEESVKVTIKSWIKELNHIDEREIEVFPSYGRALETFYLTDQALIWQACKSMERMDCAPQAPEDRALKTMASFLLRSLGIDPPPELDAPDPKATIYSPTRLQHNMLERFTVENPAMKQKMIAVTRDPTQTRFLLRSKDIALFHAMEKGLFDEIEADGESREYIKSWKNTLSCQKYHDENDDTTWEDPRRFALSILMARYHCPINKRSVEEMLTHATAVLTKDVALNGIFPGKIDERYNSVIYDKELLRDDYWGVTFEVPYVLWKSHLLSQREPVPVSTASRRPAVGDPALTPPGTASEGRIPEQQGSYDGEEGLPDPPASMKRTFPLNKIVDEGNVVELHDEWLYKKPAFFVRRCQSPEHQDDPVNRSAEQEHCHFIGILIDIPKSKRVKKRSVGDVPLRILKDGEEVQNIVWKGRTEERAKKRLWAIFSPTAIPKEICCNTVSPYEDDAGKKISAFVSRHKSHQNYFREDISAVLNSWDTEIHISFPCLTSLETNDNPQLSEAFNALTFEKPTFLKTASISCQFEGDLFDRYWTCRFLEEMPDVQVPHEDYAKMIVENWQHTLDPSPHPDKKSIKKGHWQQRKVLELVLFGKIARDMNKKTYQILEDAQKIFGIAKSDYRDKFSWIQQREGSSRWDRGAFRNDKDEGKDYVAFLRMNKDFRKFQSHLQTAERHLTESLIRIEQWTNRDEGRQAERTRWTLNDESRYRVTILKLKVSNEHDIQEIRRTQAEFRTLIELITKDLELMRSDLEIIRSYRDLRQSIRDRRHALDIRFFTYVTAIFLPLGFATSIFSMSEAPNAQTLKYMIATALGGLAFTAVLAILSILVTRFNLRDLNGKAWTLGFFHLPGGQSKVCAGEKSTTTQAGSPSNTTVAKHAWIEKGFWSTAQESRDDENQVSNFTSGKEAEDLEKGMAKLQKGQSDKGSRVESYSR